MPRHNVLPALLACTLIACALIATTAGCVDTATPAPTRSTTPTATAQAGPAVPPKPAPGALAALPALEYNAVIGGLVAAPARATIAARYTVTFDTAVYGADFTTPIARIPARDFLGEKTTVVPVEQRGDWSLILTPARQKLPSTATAEAPALAQTAAWVPTKELVRTASLSRRVEISTSKQTLSILDAKGAVEQSFPVGVGTADTPTPTGTGYLQARYLDPEQGQDEHRIQLTSLHATAADEPYGGTDGGLIGIHYQSTARGAVSHGCVRLSAEAIAAVDALPLGTAVRITG